MIDYSAPTYDELHELSLQICRQLCLLSFDGVIAPSRGGLLFGMIASHFFKVPLIPISYSSKKGKGDDKNHDNILPEIPTGNYLLVDDICDSGQTMLELMNFYAGERNNVVYTAAWYCKASPAYFPTMYGVWDRNNKMGFINFPYEVQ